MGYYLEFKNVRGNPGWLLGKADYISFETNVEWLIVDRLEIMKVYGNHQYQLVELKPYKDPKLYKLYHRDKRDDRFIMVETSELRKIAKHIIKK